MLGAGHVDIADLIESTTSCHEALVVGPCVSNPVRLTALASKSEGLTPLVGALTLASDGRVYNS